MILPDDDDGDFNTFVAPPPCSKTAIVKRRPAAATGKKMAQAKLTKTAKVTKNCEAAKATGKKQERLQKQDPMPSSSTAACLSVAGADLKHKVATWAGESRPQ